MVQISSENRVDSLSDWVYRIFRIQEYFTHIKEIDCPDIKPCIYAMWHSDQFCIHGLKDRGNVNVMISRSDDGEIIARVVQKWGFQTVRGSKGKKGSVEATMQMISRLKNDQCAAMMVDGPHGPVHIVKKGVIKVAKLSGAPIVPVVWYSRDWNWVKFPSWDKLSMPLGNVRLINLYGKPINVTPEENEEADEEARLAVQTSLLELQSRMDDVWKDVYGLKLWKRKK